MPLLFKFSVVPLIYGAYDLANVISYSDYQSSSVYVTDNLPLGTYKAYISCKDAADAVTTRFAGFSVGGGAAITVNAPVIPQGSSFAQVLSAATDAKLETTTGSALTSFIGGASTSLNNADATTAAAIEAAQKLRAKYAKSMATQVTTAAVAAGADALAGGLASIARNPSQLTSDAADLIASAVSNLIQFSPTISATVGASANAANSNAYLARLRTSRRSSTASNNLTSTYDASQSRLYVKMAAAMVAGQPPQTTSSDVATTVIQKLTTSTISESHLGRANFSSFASTSAQFADGVLSAAVTEKKTSGYAQIGVKLTTGEKQISMYNSSNYEQIITGLSSPTQFQFSSQTWSTCVYWDTVTQTWSTTGVTTLGQSWSTTGVIASDNIITCSTSHFTSFAAKSSSAPPPPSPSPTPTTAPSPSPSTAPEGSALIGQEVTFSGLSTSQFTGKTKHAYNVGWGQAIGVFSRTSTSYGAVTSTAKSGRRGIIIVGYEAQVLASLLAAVRSSAGSISMRSLQDAINSAIAELGYSNIPAPIVSSISAVECSGSSCNIILYADSSGGLSGGMIALIVVMSLLGAAIGVVLFVCYRLYFRPAGSCTSSHKDDPGETQDVTFEVEMKSTDSTAEVADAPQEDRQEMQNPLHRDHVLDVDDPLPNEENQPLTPPLSPSQADTRAGHNLNLYLDKPEIYALHSPTATGKRTVISW